jgi:hypothetical protein
MRHSVVGQIYGYLICLFAVLLFVHSMAGLVNGAFGISGPVRAFAGPGHFRLFHAGGSYGWQARIRPGTMPAAPPPRVRFALPIERGPSIHGIVLNVLLLIVAVLLFGLHWRWLERGQPS